MAKGTPIYGDAVRAVREQLFLTQAEFAARLGTSLSSVQRIEGLVIASISKKTLRKLAEVARAEPAGMLERLKAPDGVLEQIAAEEGKPIEAFSPIDSQGNSDVENNVDGYTEKRFFEIPLFDLVISAGGWAEVAELGETHDPRSIDQGLFRVRVGGDSMSTLFPDACIVEFRVIRPSSPGIEIGKHYYVQREDNLATFKTLKKMDRETLTLHAFNKKKYPEPLVVVRQDVVRIAVAVNKVEAV